MSSPLQTTVLDASTLLRFLWREAGADQVEIILEEGARGLTRVVISAVNWGEVFYKVLQRQGRAAAEQLEGTLLFFNLQIETATAARASQAAYLRQTLPNPYADAFCVELAASIAHSVLLTADHDFKVADSRTRIEYLPNKPKP